jgi:hypothetical protein
MGDGLDALGDGYKGMGKGIGEGRQGRGRRAKLSQASGWGSDFGYHGLAAVGDGLAAVGEGLTAMGKSYADMGKGMGEAGGKGLGQGIGMVGWGLMALAGSHVLATVIEAWVSSRGKKSFIRTSLGIFSAIHASRSVLLPCSSGARGRSRQ